MKYLSLFSGVGGFELGIQQAYESYTKHASIGKESQQEKRAQGGVRPVDKRKVQLYAGNRSAPLCVGYSEIDKYAIQVYEKRFKHKNYGDITKIKAEELPNFDLLVGGFPCQSFSIAGKRGGFSDTRGTLFFEIARIIKQKQPRLLLLENVKGLLNHDKGRTFGTILATLDELGYDLQWQVLNSKNFGVPQNRERIFIIGHFRGTSRPEIFPLGESNPINIKQLNKPTHSNDRIYEEKGLAPTLNTMQGGRRQPKIVASRGRNPKNPSDRTVGAPTEQRLEVNEQGTSNTLTNVQKDNWLLDEMKIRRLTPMECERLQGFPDGWTEGISDSQRYKCLGNAVTVNVIKAIIEKLL